MEVEVPNSRRFLAIAVLVATSLGHSTKAGSFSNSAGTWSWWVSGQGQTGWTQNPNTFGSRAGAFSAPAASTPAAPAPQPSALSTPVYSASSASVSAPLIAVPYNNPTPAAQPVSTYVAPSTANYSPPVSAPVLTPQPTAISPSNHVDGFINMGTGPYLADSSITTGGSQPWYNTPLVNNFFGGAPTAQQKADFSNAVLRDVQQTFAQSGVNVSLTNDPNVAANHTLSLVSNTSAALLPSAIGMTQLGGNGFSFMDQEAKSAQTLNQLELIVAHNVSHELMLAFGVGENYDHTGNYIDAPNASFSMMTSNSATFSKAAADALNQALQMAGSNTNSTGSQFAQEVGAAPVPEPAAIAVWTVGALLAMVTYRKRLLTNPSADPVV